MDDLTGIHLYIKKISDNELFQNAFYQRALVLKEYKPYENHTLAELVALVYKQSESNKTRIVSNYIRHHLTNYETILPFIKDLEDEGQRRYCAFHQYFEKAVKEAYPFYTRDLSASFLKAKREKLLRHTGKRADQAN